MKNIILKFIGLDAETIINLNQQINVLKKEMLDLHLTINNLKEEATSIYKKTEDAVIMYKELDIDKNEEKWWEKDSFKHDNHENWILANKIKDNAMKEYVKNHPSLKERFIFHGGCLGCKTPIEKGCGTCLGCEYANFGKGFPDLSTH